MQFVMIYLSAGQMLRSPGLVKLYPQAKQLTQWRHKRYTPDDIVKWTLDVAKKSEVSVNKIYLMDSPLPNAFATQRLHTRGYND